MHCVGVLRVIKSRTYLRQQSLQSTCASCRCYIKTPSSNFRAYATAKPIQRPSQIRRFLIISTIGLGAGLGYLYITDTRASVHRWLVPPLIRAIWPDAEDAHEGGVGILKEFYRFGLHPRERGRPDDAKDLETEVFGYTLVNPLGISSGLDKHGEIPTQLLALGPAVVEVGGVTPKKQSGNPKPRVFRILSQQGMINRYGLNSDGASLVAARLRQRVREYAYKQGYGLDKQAERFVLDGDAGVPPGSLVKGKLLSVQVAKNESTPDGDIEAISRDYVNATSLLAKYADIIIVNVSCPNAPGYRDLQQVEPLTKILTDVVAAAASVDRKVKVRTMVKVSPDENTEEQIASICAAVWRSGVDGVVVGNTTTSRPEGTSLSKTEAAVMEERGGYSGPQLFHRTVSLVKNYRRILDYPLDEQTTDKGMERKLKEPVSTQSNDDEPRGDSKPELSLSPHIQKTVSRDAKNLKPDTPQAHASSTSQPLIQIPPRNNPFSPDKSSPSSPSSSPADTTTNKFPPPAQSDPSKEPPDRKVIFATGGITTGKQALEVLEAGASVAQVYTALVYGGVGTITRMKDGMREEMKRIERSDSS